MEIGNLMPTADIASMAETMSNGLNPEELRRILAFMKKNGIGQTTMCQAWEESLGHCQKGEVNKAYLLDTEEALAITNDPKLQILLRRHLSYLQVEREIVMLLLETGVSTITLANTSPYVRVTINALVGMAKRASLQEEKG